MTVRTLASATLFALALAGRAVAAEAGAETPAVPTVAEETQQVDDRQVKVWAKRALSMNVKSKDEADVQSRELWYSAFDGKAWGAWSKHGIIFAREAPIAWEPTEGHWRIYIRTIKVSGLANPEPGPATVPAGEFIIDRSAPTVAIGFPGSQAKLRGGGKYTIKWEATDLHLKAAPVTLRWSRDGKGVYETIAADLPNSGTYEWTVPKDMTNAGQLQILVADKAGNVGSAESSQVLVDSISPRGRVTAPAISARSEAAYSTEIADAGPAGLSAAKLWISGDDGVTWAEGPAVTAPWKTVGWKAPADGRYRLAIVAADQAGNISATPKGKGEDQFQVIIDTTAPVITLASPVGIVEADKASSTRRAFKPGDRVAVNFGIKDVNLQANSASVYLQTDAAKPWIELGKGLPVDAAFRFAITDAHASRSARIKVTALDAAGNLGETVSTDGFQVDTEVDAGTVEIK
jgi:hypothetical protein